MGGFRGFEIELWVYRDRCKTPWVVERTCPSVKGRLIGSDHHQSPAPMETPDVGETDAVVPRRSPAAAWMACPGDPDRLVTQESMAVGGF